MASDHELRILCANIQAGGRTASSLDYLIRGWNVWLPFGKVGIISQIARVVQEHDIIGLQEADGGSLRSGFACQARMIGALAQLPHVIGQVNRGIGPIMASGNALLGKRVPRQVQSVPLPSRIPGRGVLLAEYEMENGQELSVVVAHLSLGAKARARQIDAISELLAHARHPVLMGDLNAPIDAKEMQALFSRTRLRPPDERVLTYPSWKPSRAIDHILVGGGLEMKSISSVPIGGSDHLALTSRLVLPSGLRDDGKETKEGP